MYYRRNEAQEARMRQKSAAGMISDRFPEVESIVVRMRYTKGGAQFLLRTLNYYPASRAFFKMTCHGEGCTDDGLDMSRIIQGMILNHERSAKGEIRCSSTDPAAVHADIAYEVALKYRSPNRH